MTKKILVIDCGNTQAKFGICVDSTIEYTFTLNNNKIVSEKALDIIIYDYFIKKNIATNLEHILITSVVPYIDRCLSTLLKMIFNVSIGKITYHNFSNMRIKIDNPEEIGTDRLVNAYAARHLYGTRQLIIDFGTATTLDIIDYAGDYVGGVILPGLDISLQTLHHTTAMLPLVKITRATKVLGKNTFQAINQGVYWGYVEMLDGIVKRLAWEMGYSFHVIATGGYATLWGDDCLFINAVRPELTLEGLVMLSEIINYEKQ